MSNFEESVVRIGWDFTKGLITSLSSFINSYKNSAQTKGDRSVKKYQKELEGKRFNHRDKFVVQAMKKTGKVDIEQMKINEQDFKMFDKLCRQYGVDYLYEEKPKINFQELIEKKNKTPYEEKVLEIWTEKDSNGILKESDDDVKISFRVQDINKVEFAIEDMLKKKQTLEHRISKAKEKHEKLSKSKEKVKEQLKQVVSK